MFSQSIIKNKTIKNRIIRSATNEHLGTREGIITADYLRVYQALAKNDLGIIITSHMAVNELQKVDEHQICIANKQNSLYLKQLTEIVHKEDCIVVAQLSQGGKKAAVIHGSVPLTPWCVENCCIMNQEDIRQCVKNFIVAAKIAENSGFDGVQLHLAHGYLLCDFLDSFFNNRTDEYGGNLHNRYRIIHEIIQGIRAICNENFIISVKINSTYSSFNSMPQQINVCKLLEQDGVDLIEISGFNFDQQNREHPYFLKEALQIKDNIKIPIALVGGFRKVEQMMSARAKSIDFISISRPLICDESFITKLKRGENCLCNDCNMCYSIYRTEYKRCVLHHSILPQLKTNFESHK